MTEVVLAECNGNCFMIGPMSHFHPLLLNTLGPEDKVTLHQLDSVAEVYELWHRLFGPHQEGEQPHFVHPAILGRIRRQAGPMWVGFTAMSALVEGEAKELVALAGMRAQENPEVPLTLFAEADVPGASPLAAMMTLMRLQVIEDELVASGVDRGRIRRERRTAEAAAEAGRPDDSGEGHIEIAIRAAH